MYAQGKKPESIKTTETHARRYDVTLNKHDAHRALINEACRQVGIDATNPNLKADASVWESPENWDGVCEINYSVVLIENLSTPIDEAPANIEKAVRLTPHGPPIAPREVPRATPWGHLPSCGCLECLRIAKTQPVPQDLIFATDGLGVLRVDGPVKHIGTTSPTSKLNVDAIELVKKEQPDDLAIEDLMQRVNKLHDVLLHGKGNNIVLTPGEVDTVLEYTNVGNQGKGSYAVPPYTEPMTLPMPEGASVISAARSGPVGVVGPVVELTNLECIDGKWGRSL